MSEFLQAIGFRSYLIGFVLSLGATIVAYMLITVHALAPGILLAMIVLLACAQVFSQLVFFLHLGNGARERTIALLVALGIVSILVAGSLWIMMTLQSRMAPNQERMIEYMRDQGGL